MDDREMHDLFKKSKKLAFEVFDKVAVGEIRNEFVRQLKDKMGQKLEMLSMENEKTSEQQCVHFLQQNYEGIA
jgi:hypothetical protein